MKASVIAVAVLLSIITSACCSFPIQKTEERRVSDVLNAVKDELNAYLATPAAVEPKVGVCYDGQEPMDLIPTKVTLTLKTVAAQENDPSIGLTAPIGVVSFDPSYSGAYSKARTQSLELPLDIEEHRGDRERGAGVS